MRPLVTSVAGISLMLVSFAAVGSDARPPAQADRVEHVLIGQLRELDLERGIAIVIAENRARVSLVLTPRTDVRGLTTGHSLKRLKEERHSYFIVHYSVDNGQWVAESFEYVGRDPLEVMEGPVVRFERTGGPIVVASAAGREETFHMAPRFTLETRDGIVPLVRFQPASNARLRLYYSERGGCKIAHVIRLVEPSLTRR